MGTKLQNQLWWFLSLIPALRRRRGKACQGTGLQSKTLSQVFFFFSSSFLFFFSRTQNNCSIFISKVQRCLLCFAYIKCLVNFSMSSTTPQGPSGWSSGVPVTEEQSGIWKDQPCHLEPGELLRKAARWKPSMFWYQASITASPPVYSSATEPWVANN